LVHVAGKEHEVEKAKVRDKRKKEEKGSEANRNKERQIL
jgi:hypothetical protein